MRKSGNRSRFALIFLFLIIACAGCATTPRHGTTTIPQYPGAPTYHIVKKGETVWRISKMYGIDVATLARANSINSSGYVEVGQRLVIPSSSSPVSYTSTSQGAISFTPARDSFAWPVRGTVISPFGSKFDNTKNKGIDILAEEGRPVRASRAGKVVFCDDDMEGFGKTIILDHGDSFQTVYAYNSQILVTPGAIVKQSDVIAKTGNTGRARQASLHFEIRKGGEPQNPYSYLPR